MSQATEDALDACLNAVADPLCWGTALQCLGESLGAESCTLYSKDLHLLSSLTMPVSSGHEEFLELWLRNQHHAPDPHLSLGRWQKHKGSAVVLEQQFSTDNERRTLPYYQETARPAHREWFGISNFTVGYSFWSFSVYRSARRGSFTTDEAERLAIVGPRLAPIVSMAEKFAAFQVTSSLLSLEQARCAAIVIDARGHVVNMNRSAEDMLGADLRLSAKRLVACEASSNRSLQQLVAKGIATRNGDTFVSDTVAIHCGGEALYIVEALPIKAIFSAYFSTAKLLLLVTNLRAQTSPAESVLRHALGLTSAEARLARTLALGHDLQEAGKLLAIRMPTARSQLQAIFRKTNTRRQAELMSLLTRLPCSSGLDVE